MPTVDDAQAEDRPRFVAASVARLARELFGREGELSPLVSERDANYALTTADGERFVLKIARHGEDPAAVAAQEQLLVRLAESDPSLPVPRVVPALDGRTVATVADDDGRPHLVRMLTWLPGTPLVETRPLGPGLLRDLGRVLGRLDRALEGFTHPALAQDIPWDLGRGVDIVGDGLPGVRAVRSPEDGDLLERWLARWRTALAPALGSLRRGTIHNDANDHNVLVRSTLAGQRISGLIDFGDALDGPLLGEVAIAAAYAAMDRADPLDVVARILAGYHAEHPVVAGELPHLLDLVALRLGLSVTNSARARSREPEQDYLSVSEAPAWRLLHALAAVPVGLAHAVFRKACDLPPSPTGSDLSAWLSAHREELAPIFAKETDRALREDDVTILDLSVASPELPAPRYDDGTATAAYVTRARPPGAVAVGRYDEPRLVYATEAFDDPATGERRTIHLGIDVFVDAGTPLAAPLDGAVHSVADNAATLDYGPTLVLRHVPAGCPEFFTLWGHLSRASLHGRVAGQPVRAGERLGHVGETAENGGWPSHLHLQLVTDMLGRQGEFPGVAAPDRRSVWTSLSPDPGPLLGVEAGRFAAPRHGGTDALLAERSRRLGPSLGVSYRRPLHIVRGAGSRLFDVDGRAYLDAVNNVPHVGHGHPRVVAAGQRQMAVLNTNTRYLHEGLVRYARRLADLFPDPLEVCFLVNSGSEANELALRLARAASGGSDWIVVSGGYHGNTGALVDLSTYKCEGPGGSGLPRHVHKVPMPDTYRGLHGGDGGSAGERYASHVDGALAAIASAGRSVAGFLAEALLGCGGQIVPPPGWLAGCYERVRAAGGVCIADEVQTGFGRVGSHLWAYELQGVVPDVVTLGKPMGNGHPLGAVVTTRAIARGFATGMEWFSTFGGNPVSCAIGEAVLDVLEDEQLQQRAESVGARLQAGLDELANRHALIGDVRGHGLFLGIELVRDPVSKEAADAEASYVVERMRDHRILLSTDGPLHNVIKIKPPLVFDARDADRLVATLDAVLWETCLRR